MSRIDTLPHVRTAPLRARRRWPQRTWRWWIAASSLAIAIVAPLPYLTSSLGALAKDDNTIAVNYHDRPLWVQVIFYAHICFGGIAMLVTPLQLSSRVRARWPRAHRVAGRLGLSAILVAAFAGLGLAPFNSAHGIGVAGFGLLAIAWFTCAVATYRTIRRGNVAAHRRWALRTFALTYAAVTLRLWLGVLIPAQMALADVSSKVAFDRAYHLVPFLAWVPNLLVTELYLERR